MIIVYISYKWTYEVQKVIFIQIFCFVKWLHLTLVMVSCVFPDTEWSKWGIFHRAFGVPPPHSALPVLHRPAVAFPSYPLLFLPGPSPLQPPYVPLPSSRLPSSQFRNGPEEAGAHHRGRVPGLVPVPGEMKLSRNMSSSQSFWPAAIWVGYLK